jgi:predicted acyltransferase
MNYIQHHCEAIIAQLPKHRLLAIDALRGITITAMILVNNPGSWAYIYSPLKHAQWHGWTITDLIFPFFVFIVGISIHISVSRQLSSGIPKSLVIKHAAFRMIKLILLGWFLALFYYSFTQPDYNWFEQRLMSIRFMGVLQRIGLVYFISVILALYCRTVARVVVFVGILIGYWLALTLIPYADASGNHYIGVLDYGNNLSAWLDNAVFPGKHLYYGQATPFAFDPEGLLSTLPAVATCLSGIVVGQWLMLATKTTQFKSKALFIIGLVFIIVAEIWGGFFPINKALWTSSYVLLSSGYACVVLGALLWIIDVRSHKNWTAPFIVFGANSIAFFMFAGIVARILIMIPVAETSLKGWLYHTIYQPLLGDINGSLAFAISFLIISYFVMLKLYQRGIFWKV